MSVTIALAALSMLRSLVRSSHLTLKYALDKTMVLCSCEAATQVDVVRADIEELVRLTKGGVEVYLDDTTKPPVGEGFNRHARVKRFT